MHHARLCNLWLCGAERLARAIASLRGRYEARHASVDISADEDVRQSGRAPRYQYGSAISEGGGLGAQGGDEQVGGWVPAAAAGFVGADVADGRRSEG